MLSDMSSNIHSCSKAINCISLSSPCPILSHSNKVSGSTSTIFTKKLGTIAGYRKKFRFSFAFFCNYSKSVNRFFVVPLSYVRRHHKYRNIRLQKIKNTEILRGKYVTETSPFAVQGNVTSCFLPDFASTLSREQYFYF